VTTEKDRITGGRGADGTAQPAAPGGGQSDAAQGLAVVARSQGQLVRRRFLRHRAAMLSIAVLALVVLLAFSSIGYLGIPGWWKHSYDAAGTVVNRGAPTLSVVPTWLGGNGVSIGDHPFGQDDLGRDYFALTMRGAQISLLIALVVGIVSTVVGTVIGALSGYYRGIVETVLMRFTDVVITIPVLVIAAVLGQKYGNGGPFVLALVVSAVTWTSLARLVRGEFLSQREKEFVEAARALGAKPRRIIFRHILPNTVGVITVAATLSVATAILLETALSYLGFGVRAPDTSLGLLVSTYQNAFTTRPWLFWWPGLFIVLIALCVNFIGDGLRDAFDPRQNRVRA
jgi:ABC-type dipeptide/oligopeptide/nickel transport system permease subunit